MKSVSRTSRVMMTTASVALAMSGVFVGCGGSTGGSGDTGGGDFSGGSSAGQIRLVLNETRLSVSETTGFRVKLTDANGAPNSSGTRITCDTEDGLRIVEPSSCSENTDSNSEFSGQVGCTDAGSYLMACRLPNGGRTVTATIICSGTAPSGFDNFGESCGGGLGGGSGGNGTFDPTQIRVTGVTFTDAGNSSGAIDTERESDCDSDVDTNDPEPFTDATVTFSITNGSNQAVNLTSFTYTVPDFNGSADFDSSTIAFSGDNGLTIEAGASGTLTGFFARAVSGGKTLIGTAGDVPADLGFRNITFRVAGVADNGEEVEITAVSGANLQRYNNCS